MHHWELQYRVEDTGCPLPTWLFHVSHRAQIQNGAKLFTFLSQSFPQCVNYFGNLFRLLNNLFEKKLCERNFFFNFFQAVVQQYLLHYHRPCCMFMPYPLRRPVLNNPIQGNFKLHVATVKVNSSLGHLCQLLKCYQYYQQLLSQLMNYTLPHYCTTVIT